MRWCNNRLQDIQVNKEKISNRKCHRCHQKTHWTFQHDPYQSDVLYYQANGVLPPLPDLEPAENPKPINPRHQNPIQRRASLYSFRLSWQDQIQTLPPTSTPVSSSSSNLPPIPPRNMPPPRSQSNNTPNIPQTSHPAPHSTPGHSSIHRELSDRLGSTPSKSH